VSDKKNDGPCDGPKKEKVTKFLVEEEIAFAPKGSSTMRCNGKKDRNRVRKEIEGRPERKNAIQHSACTAASL